MKKAKKGSKQKEIDSLKNQLARVFADYDNLTKRVARQNENLSILIKAQFMSQLIPSFDMLYDASKHIKDKGLKITIQTLEESLKREGIERIVPKKSDLFEEGLHEVVDAANIKGKENGEIVDIIMVGWKLGDTIIRPAKVRVNRD